MIRICLFIILVMVPTAANAAVYISEIAWMGSTDSANHEWIELHNDGEATDVTGWTLSDGMNLNVELSGVISPGAYVVLERTSDESSSAVSAFLIYTGALVNTGATLELSRADGSLVDKVTGGEDWGLIGGDNVTKETAQYTTGGWITAEATPGKVNKTKNVTQTKSEPKNSGAGPVAKPVEKEPTILVLPDVTLKLDISARSTGYVNQPIEFHVEPSGIGDTLIDSLVYEWNFGDTFISNEQSPHHIFEYPGTYIVTVYANFKRQKQMARHEITILPVSASLTLSKDGNIQVNNDSPYEINLSNYKLVGQETVYFPERSILLPNQTITVEKSRLGGSNFLIALYDSKGDLVASKIPNSLSRNELANDVDEIKLHLETISPMGFSNERPSTFSFVNEAEARDIDFVETESYNQESLSGVSLKNNEVPQNWPYIALSILLFIAVGATFVSSKSNEIT